MVWMRSDRVFAAGGCRPEACLTRCTPTLLRQGNGCVIGTGRWAPVRWISGGILTFAFPDSLPPTPNDQPLPNAGNGRIRRRCTNGAALVGRARQSRSPSGRAASTSSSFTNPTSCRWVRVLIKTHEVKLNLMVTADCEPKSSRTSSNELSRT
jgi:hypothetical protein